MKKEDLKTKVSKYMSYLLRHNPEDLKMDSQGFVDLEDLIKKLKEKFQIDRNLIFEIVRKSERKRFEIKNGKIRALYGHSIPVKLKLKEDRTVKVLYHGTTPEAAAKILKTGIKPMKRKWVHLSPTIEIAKQIALRRTNNQQ
ncbi:RNA 2'-phosphotransferase [Candidatus Bathyarchaeota archaeon]|nr:MAG: RNA 2'-phosphotransferase [Candidatus Bathyarchaeota archaeon]